MPSRLPAILQDEHDPPAASECASKADRLTLSVPARLKRAGLETKMIIDVVGPNGGKAKPDASLIKLVIKAHALQEKLLKGNGLSLGGIAKRERLSGSYFTRLLRLAFLSPDVTKAILEGRHPPGLTAAKLMRASRLPLNWKEQRAALGFD